MVVSAMRSVLTLLRVIECRRSMKKPPVAIMVYTGVATIDVPAVPLAVPCTLKLEHGGVGVKCKGRGRVATADDGVHAGKQIGCILYDDV